MIRIYNMRRRKPKTSFDVRVDRWSILGNPYKMRTESERDLVCDQYETYFNNIVGNNREWLIQNGIDDDYRQEFMDELNRIRTIYQTHGKLNLFCWCYPKRCHSYTIKNYILNTSQASMNNN